MKYRSWLDAVGQRLHHRIAQNIIIGDLDVADDRFIDNDVERAIGQILRRRDHAHQNVTAVII